MNASIRTLIDENQELLRQTQQLLDRLESDGYRCHHPALGAGSIGEHVRHIIEHYEELLGPARYVDYDQRRRDHEPQASPRAGQQRLRSLQQRLEALLERNDPADQALTVGYQPDTGGVSEGIELASSLGRELAFLSSHSLHHMALIRMLALQLGVVPSADFGVARATREFRERQRAPAVGADPRARTQPGDGAPHQPVAALAGGYS